MAREKILVVEDEENILELLRYNLERDHYQVVIATTGEEALKQAAGKHPDLVLLDLMLPGIDGLEVCRRLKAEARTSGIPVVMLTARGEEADIVAGLELGAEDYITKPFSPRVLLARLKNVFRRRRAATLDETVLVRIADFVIDPKRHQVTVKGKAMQLTFTEFRILQLLAQQPGWVFTRNQIVEAIRGDDYPVTERSVDVHIVSLRRKCGAAGKMIETVRGIGYKFKD